MSLGSELNAAERREYEEIQRARAEGFEGDSLLQLALWREEQREAAKRSALINSWAGGMFSAPKQEQ